MTELDTCAGHHDISGLRDSNSGRIVRAAQRDVAIAQRLLLRSDLTAAAWDDRQRDVAAARLGHPEWSWAQIGASLGLTKDQAVGVFRRMAQLAGLREDYPRTARRRGPEGEMTQS